VNRALLVAAVGIGLLVASGFSGHKRAQAISSEACGDDPRLPTHLVARCGLVTIDRPDGTGGSLALWTVVVEPVSRTTAVPLLKIPAGPGSAGTFKVSNDVALFSEAFAGRPVVFVDPRGVGKSGGLLDCIPYDFDDWPVCLGLITPTGIDTSFYASESIADDYDALRDALGVPAVGRTRRQLRRRGCSTPHAPSPGDHAVSRARGGHLR
jgi:pimeloyl-ACP methyl ester carboxylesterase